jgi:hypothetical protein
VDGHGQGVIEFTVKTEFGPRMKIVQRHPPGLVVWDCVGGHEPRIGNTFHVEIVGQDSGSRVRFRQEYSRELSDDQYGIYHFNWGDDLDRVRLYGETGTGKPFAPVARAGGLGV